MNDLKAIDNTDEKNRTKRLAWLTALLCIGCCSIPFILGLFLGFSALAGMAVYFESAALGIVLIASGIFVYGRHKKKKKQATDGPSCDTGCGCKNA